MRGNILIDSETNNCFRRRVERRPLTFVSLAFLSSNYFLKRILRSQLPVIECLTDLWSVVCLQPSFRLDECRLHCFSMPPWIGMEHCPQTGRRLVELI